jgi:DNA-binding LytR/AlgR family response regulator
MKKINCVIADDEKLARSVLEEYVSRIEGLNIIAFCSNGTEVFNALNKHAVDLLFLDIKMPQLGGMDLLKTVPGLPPVILTTAYSEYALESYQFNVVDYLVKPIPFERFVKALKKFTELHREPDPLLKVVEAPVNEQSFIFVRSEKKMVKLFFNDILYFEGLKDYVQVYTKDKKIITHQTLNTFEQKLPSTLFLRVHRSFLISLQAVTSYTASAIEINGREIPIGDVYKKKISETLSF